MGVLMVGSVENMEHLKIFRFETTLTWIEVSDKLEYQKREKHW